MKKSISITCICTVYCENSYSKRKPHNRYFIDHVFLEAGKQCVTGITVLVGQLYTECTIADACHIR